MPSRTLSEDEFNAIKQGVIESMPAGYKEDDFQRQIGPLMSAAIATAENSPEPATGSSVGRFVKGAWNVLNPLNIVSAAMHPIDTAENIVGASVDQARKASGAFSEGRYVEAAGHAAGTLPIIGPAAAHAGEQIAAGNIAGGLGEGGGLLAPFGIRKALEARSAANPAAADIATRAATDKVSQQVLAPANPRFKAQATRIAPEVLARKLVGGREELRQAAYEGMADAGQRIDDAVAASGGAQAPVPAQSLIADLRSRIADLKDSNGVAISDRAAQRIGSIEKRITQIRSLAGRRGTVTYDDLKKLRDESYSIADEARGYEVKGNPAMSHEGWAARETGSSIRKVFAQHSPDAAKANADYSFFKTLDDVLDLDQGRPKSSALPSGVTGGERTYGAVVGNMTKIPGAAFVLSTVVPWVKERLASPEWQLAKAHEKMALAEAMRKGDIGRMKSLMSRFGEGNALATNPNESRSRSTGPATAIP